MGKGNGSGQTTDMFLLVHQRSSRGEKGCDKRAIVRLVPQERWEEKALSSAVNQSNWCVHILGESHQPGSLFMDLAG